MADYTLTKTGAQIDAIHTKVDGIEAGADVTDETNVSATASVIANTAKISFDATSSAKLATIEENADVTDEANVSATASVIANSAKVTNATHTGDVSGSTTLTIGDDKVTEPMLKSTNAPTDNYLLSYDLATTGFTWVAVAGGGDALTSNPLSQFAATTSAQLLGVLSDETGTGSAVFATSPTLVTPILGTPTSGTLTNCTGLPAAGLSDVTSNAAELNILDGATLNVTELNYVDGVTSAIQTQIDVKVSNDTTGEPTGSDGVLKIVSLTQAEYDAGTPVATSVYLITDA